jgi:adenylate cyclase
MATEIERKFLVHADWPRPSLGTRLRQGYLSQGGPVSVRIRTSGERAWLTVKGPTSGIARAEFEYEVPPADAEEMLALARTGVIDKTRYLIDHGQQVIEVDVFGGENTGLVVAEVELGAIDEEFVKPAWLGDEVSTDPRYRNSALAERPFSTW